MSQAGGFVPPPPREPQTPSGRKSNADFRKIMATPRHGSSDSGAAPTSIAVPSTPDASMKPPAKKKQKKWRPPPEKKKEDSLYRDRAKERREGDNPDYLGVETELASSGYQSVAPPSVGGTSEEERQRQIEHSKYLGGDMEHTHLVKGLDFALLNRIRSEIHKQKEEDKEAKEQAESSSSSTAATSQEKSEGPHFRGALGRNIHNFLFEDDIVDEEEEEEAAAKPKVVAPNNPNKPLKQTDVKKKKLTRRELLSKRVAEAFLKGRTTYVFDAESKFSQSDIPTIMLRSKRDCPQRGERMVSNVPTEIVQQVSKIMEYLKPAHKSKKQKHSEKRKTVAELTQPTVELVNKMQDKGKEKEQERTSIMALGFIKPVAKQKQADAGISSLFEDLLGKAPAKKLDLDDDDIFPEVGSDYVCRPTKEQEEAAKKVLEQEQQAMAEQQQNAAEVDAMMLTEEGKESKGHTIYEKEVAARTKAVQDDDLLQDYFGTGPKKRKREEPVASQSWKQHGEEEDEDEDEDDEDEDESEEEKEKMGDVQKSERSGEEGEQPMEGVEEGPVREQDVEGPQRPPESDYDVMMPSAGYMDPSEAYDMYPPPPPAGAEGEEVYSSYPDTDAQYATAVTAYGYGAPLATMLPPPPAPLPPQQQAEHKPEGAVVVTKALSAQEQRDRGMATVFKRDDERLFSKNRKRDDREKNPTFVPDEYAECYPGAYESAFTKTVVDDDSDDEDLSKMDAGTKARKKIRPWHFETDEAWAKYNETLEATPKAAFQFGVKMTDGRKKGNLKKKKKSEDAKLNEQLQKINQFNAKKKDV